MYKVYYNVIKDTNVYFESSYHEIMFIALCHGQCLIFRYKENVDKKTYPYNIHDFKIDLERINRF